VRWSPFYIASPYEAMAEALRQEGNALYKQGQFKAAAVKYREATRIANADDALPFSNLSAVLYELGKYPAAAMAAQRALEINNGRADPVAGLSAKLLARRAQALLQSKDLQSDVDLSSHDPKYAAVLDTRRRMTSIAGLATEIKMWEMIWARLPRYKATLHEKPLYGVFGHDEFKSVWQTTAAEYYDVLGLVLHDNDSRLRPTPALSGETVSFYFGGIGDARHLYATLMVMRTDFAASQPKPVPAICVVANDVNPIVLARNFIIWHLLQQVARAPRGSTMRMLLLSTLYYTFSAPLMPPSIYEMLQKEITVCIDMLERPTTILPWVRCSVKLADRMSQTLKTWMKEIPNSFTATQFQESHTRPLFERPTLTGPDFAESQYAHESSVYEQTLMLVPDAETQKQDPRLMGLYRACSRGQQHVRALREHVGRSWRINPTLLDVGTSSLRNDICSAFPVPFALVRQLPDMRPPPNPHHFFDYCSVFWSLVAEALADLQPLLTLHISIADCVDELEQLSIRGYSDNVRLPPKTRFDRTHFSNIPDYTGMNLFTFMHATPALMQHAGATGIFNCLACPPRWSTINHYNAESLHMYREADMASVFNARYSGWSKFFDGSESELPEGSMPMMNYTDWQSITETPLNFESLMPRKDFTHWLYSVYMALVLPAPRDAGNWGPSKSAIVRSPLNQTAFIRLLIRLSSVGYPKHWLSAILTSLLTNDTTSTARPPSECPITLGEVDRRNAAANFDSSPWIAELSTLTTQFLRVLPFAVIVEDGVLQAPDQIRECTVTWKEQFHPDLSLIDAERADWILLLANWDTMEPRTRFANFDYGNGPGLLRRLMMSPSHTERMKDKHHFITCWKWDVKKRKAIFWLREDMTHQLDGHEWDVDFVRIDQWGFPGQRFPFSLEVEWSFGRTWSEVLADSGETG
jgi:tetratricopeptide (TPR) repeat protein